MLSFIADCSVIAIDDPQNTGYQVGLALVRLRKQMTDLPTDDVNLLALLNSELIIKGLPVLAAARISKPEDIPLGTTGKVLKRLLRKKFRDYLRTNDHGLLDHFNRNQGQQSGIQI